MKKLFLFLLILSVHLLHAQPTITTYRMYFSNTEKMIGVDGKSLIIQIDGEKSYSEVYLYVSAENIPDFRHAFRQTVLKYKEWKDIAIKNNIKNLDKNIDKFKA